MNEIDHPLIRTDADIKELEKVPLEDRVGSWDCFELIARGASLDPDKIALSYLTEADPAATPQTFTYRDLLARFHQAANLFHAAGIGPTDCVLTLLPNTPQLYFAQIGGMGAGIIGNVNWMLEPEALVEIVLTARAKALVVLGSTPGFEIWEKFQQIRDQLPDLEHVYTVPGPGGTVDPDTDFEVALDTQLGHGLNFDRDVSPDDIAAYIHSGGTTGTPKLAKLTHRGFAFKGYANTVVLAHQPDDVIFADYPMFHVAGFFGRGVLPLIVGSSILIPSILGARDKKFVKNYWKLVERYRISYLSGVPSTLSVLVTEPPTDEDISSLRPYGATGSTAFPIEIAKQVIEACGVRMLPTFGATEFTQNATQVPRDGEIRHGSAGLRLPYTEIKAVELGDDGQVERECAAGEIGIIVVRSPGIIPGYVDPAHDVGKFLPDGWFNTGDLGRIDADGYLWITGREKDVIIRGGHNIEPAIIEEALLKHEAVQLAAAVGMPDAYAGELPMAYVQLKEGASVTGDELAAFAGTQISERAATPKLVVVLDKLPLTDVGKARKDHLRFDAAERVFRTALGDLDCDVTVAAHAEHGALATVTVVGKAENARTNIQKQIHAALSPFALQHTVAWR